MEKQMLEKIFEKAKQHGISRGAIGIRAYGRTSYSLIYNIKNPTIKTLEKLDAVVDELIAEKIKKLKKSC